MKRSIFLLIMFMLAGFQVSAQCPDDHLKIGRNPDGTDGTGDDMKLFIDVTDKYRHSDPAQMGADTWLNWYYPMSLSVLEDYRIGEPGFELLHNHSNQELVGAANSEYRLWIECVAISEGLTVQNTAYGISLRQPGDAFCHSCQSGDHLHLHYIVAGNADLSRPYWITYRVFDEWGYYSPSEPVTVVFLNPPMPGDLTLDGTVGTGDLAVFLEYWLASSDATHLNSQGQAAYDLFERADINRDYAVDLADFAILAANWWLTP